jgi:hypothetical protein
MPKAKQPLAYYLIRSGSGQDDGTCPVCTVCTEDGAVALVLLTDGEAAEQFRDDWAEELGWEVGFMDNAPMIKWLEEQHRGGVHYVLLDPVYEGPNDFLGEVFEIKSLIAAWRD